MLDPCIGYLGLIVVDSLCRLMLSRRLDVILYLVYHFIDLSRLKVVPANIYQDMPLC